MIRGLLVLLMYCLSMGHINAQDDGIELSGDILQLALPAAAFGTTLIWKDDTKPMIQVLKTFGVSFAVTQSAKIIIDRERPNGKGRGFPSGHTSSAFTGAAVLQKRFGWKVGIPSYLLASYVGWTRVETLNHDYWDVAAGAAVGIASAYLFVKPYKNPNINVDLLPTDDGVSMQLKLRF